MNKTIRKINLYNLGIGDKPKELEILEQLNGLNQYTNVEWPNSIFWGMSENDIITQHYLKDDIFYISYDKIWGIFENEFNMKFSDVQELTKWYIINYLNLKVRHTYNFIFKII